MTYTKSRWVYVYICIVFFLYTLNVGLRTFCGFAGHGIYYRYAFGTFAVIGDSAHAES